ncbi:MAG: NUDIX domain-containing protein, partial [Nitrosopumilus sp.]
GTFASHPRESETYVSSGERRMPEELGIECKLDYLFKFEYHVPYKDIGSENEVCGTLIGVVDESSPFKKIEGEIDEIKWISAEELLLELKSQPEVYCPWMIIALELLDKSEKSMLQKYENIFKSWMSSEMHEAFQQAIKLHLPDNNWRLVQ